MKLISLLIVMAGTVVLVGLTAESAPRLVESSGAWRDDPAWHQGPAEWALYDAVRPIYGVPRAYEATIFTNKQRMDPATTTKAARGSEPGAFEVFKHNLSEMIPVENYTYRFLTTAFVRTDDLTTYKLAFSSQEDCGATYKQFVVDGDSVAAEQFCYFPNAGAAPATYRRPGALAFHDGLSLTLRDYPFDSGDHPDRRVKLVPDQTDTHATGTRPEDATVTYVERATVEVPYGSVDAHHLRVTHRQDGGTTTSDYWFAADPELRHVMVKYTGPYGVEYELKQLDWWAYWDRSQRRPR